MTVLDPLLFIALLLTFFALGVWSGTRIERNHRNDR